MFLELTHLAASREESSIRNLSQLCSLTPPQAVGNVLAGFNGKKTCFAERNSRILTRPGVIQAMACLLIVATGFILTGCIQDNNYGTDKDTSLSIGPLQPIKPGNIRVDGEIGRRIDMTIEKNLLALDYQDDFLKPFIDRMPAPKNKAEWREFEATGRKSFNGLGETVDAAVFFAAYSGDPRVLDLKKSLIDTILATQELDGYIGQFHRKQNNRQIFNAFGAEDMPFLDTSIRPDGLSVRVSGCSPGHSLTQEPDLSLTLTEFPDPDGQEIYFGLSDPSVAVEDELMGK